MDDPYCLGGRQAHQDLPRRLQDTPNSPIDTSTGHNFSRGERGEIQRSPGCDGQNGIYPPTKARPEGSSPEGMVQLLGRRHSGWQQIEVGVAELAADDKARSMDRGRRGSFGPRWRVLGTLGQDSGGSERRDAAALPAVGGFPMGLRHQCGGPLPPLFRRQMLPAGQRIELQGLSDEVPPESVNSRGTY